MKIWECTAKHILRGENKISGQQ